MEKSGEDPETSPESTMMYEDPANTEFKTNHSGTTENTNNATDNCVGQALGETGNKPVKNDVEPPVDWLEPLEEDYDEDDDDQSWDLDGNREADMEIVSRESERCQRGRGGGVVGKRRGRRRQFTSDEGWEECPVLGEGWKRKVVFRRSGMSVGQSDTYYMSPTGDRLRSKIELLRCIRNTIDLTHFDFKMGKFVAGEVSRRGPKRKKLGHSSSADCGFSSESSFHNEVADAGDRTYSPGPPFSLTHSAHYGLNPTSSQSEVGAGVPSPGTSHIDPSLTHGSPATVYSRHGSPSKGHSLSQSSEAPAGSKVDPTRVTSRAVFSICIRCRNSFTGLEGQTSCEKCSKACNATKDDRNIVFRKWLPCGFCQACQATEDCGVCASCRNGKLNPDSRRPIRCRRRKCLCPSLKRRSERLTPAAPFSSTIHRPERRLSERLEAIKTISKTSMAHFKDSQYSDSDEQSPFDDDNSEVLPSKSRRSCGRCKGCASKTDCGVCDFCVDKPKFGGSNKKKQKCRRRQCQRETIGWAILNRPRFAYGRKKISRRSQEHWDFEFSDNEGEQERRTKDGTAGTGHVRRDRHGSCHYNGQAPPQPSLHMPPTVVSERTAPSPVQPVFRWKTSLQVEPDAVTKNGLQARRDAVKRPTAVGAEHMVSAAARVMPYERETWHVSRAPERTRGGASVPPRSPVLQRCPDEEDEEEEKEEEEGEDQEGPTIMQIFSLGGRDKSGVGVDLEPELLQLLSALRASVLPVLWCAVLAEGPRLQLLQCSKLSSMADTAVQIEPGFCYHVSVQGQPLLPTHKIYCTHPTRLTSAQQVAALLEDLERYAVCPGTERGLPTGAGPVIPERAATCEFLVPPEAKCCIMCKQAQKKQ